MMNFGSDNKVDLILFIISNNFFIIAIVKWANLGQFLNYTVNNRVKEIN